MLRRLGPQPFPLPILFGDSVIYLTEWEITRGQSDSYDAYGALVAYNPEWANILAAAPSITTQTFSVDGYLDALADDAAATSALSTTNAFTLTKSWGQGSSEAQAFAHGSNYFFEFKNERYNSNLNALGAGDTFTVTVGTTTYNFTVASTSISGSAFRVYVSEETSTIIGNTVDDTSVAYAFSMTVTQQNGTYYNTTDAEFRKTTDSGTTWAATDITDTTLANDANAVFVPPSDASTSLEMRTYLDTGENYNENNTYYFYNGTAIREVTAFTPSVEAVAVLSNYLLDANAPDALSFNTETGVISGDLPLTSRVSRVYFTVDVDVENRKVRIPVRLTPFDTILLTWTVQAGVDEGFTVSGYGIRAINDEDLQYQKLWAEEHASAPDVVKDAIYYNTTDDAFYVEVAFGTSQERWTAISSPTAFDVDGNVTWLGPLDGAGVRQYFIDNTYDSTQPYYYYDTTLGEVRKIEDYTDLGATYGAPLANLQLSPLGDLFTIDDLVVDFSAPLDHTDSDETQTLTGTVRAAGEEVPISLTVTIQPGPQLPSPDTALTPGNTYITVTWEAVFGATGYAVFYRTANPGEWIQVERADPTALTETIGPLSNDVEYDVNVVALSPKYRDSSPQAVPATPTSPPAYFTWLTGTSAFMVNGKTWVLSSTTQTQTWIIGNETFMLDGEAWLIN